MEKLSTSTSFLTYLEKKIQLQNLFALNLIHISKKQSDSDSPFSYNFIFDFTVFRIRFGFFSLLFINISLISSSSVLFSLINHCSSSSMIHSSSTSRRSICPSLEHGVLFKPGEGDFIFFPSLSVKICDCDVDFW